MPSNVGRFVARYLQVLAGLQLVASLIGLYWDACNFPLLALLLFWAASALQSHSPAARRWVIGFGILLILMGLSMGPIAWFGGNVNVQFLGFRVEDPSPMLVAAMSGLNALVGAVPVGLLLTGQARREFARADFRRRGLCLACGYDLRGSAGRDACPECGGSTTVARNNSAR